MRVMNGRLHNFMRSPLMRNQMDHQHSHHRGGGHRHRGHHHQHHARQAPYQNDVGGGGGWGGARRDSGMGGALPKCVQFDESSDHYRCLCGCLHIKTGTMVIAFVELALILLFFLNALLIVLQQKTAYDGNQQMPRWHGESDYVPYAFAATAAALVLATAAVLMALWALSRSSARLLLPHLVVQCLAIPVFVALLVVGAIALVTDSALFYRLLNAAPFNEYPGQMTVALPADLAVRVYATLGAYLVALALELWFVVVVYDCYRYLSERRSYMDYCLAYSTPMKTLHSAR